MFIIILILCLFVAVLIYGFFTIRKLNRQIEEFQNQSDRIDDLSGKVNAITSKIDFLTIENEGTQEKHFDIESNSLMMNNRYFYRHPDDIMSDNSQEDNKETIIPEQKEIKPEINVQSEKIEENNEEDKLEEDTKSNNSINFNKIIDLDNNDDIKNFDIEVDNDENSKITEPIKENEQNFFLEPKEDIQANSSNDENVDENNDDQHDDQPDNNDDSDLTESNNEISIDYTNIKKFIETHPLNKIRVPVMRDFIVNSKIDIIVPGITGLKREEMYNKLKELIKDK